MRAMPPNPCVGKSHATATLVNKSQRPRKDSYAVGSLGGPFRGLPNEYCTEEEEVMRVGCDFGIINKSFELRVAMLFGPWEICPAEYRRSCDSETSFK